MAPAAWRTGDLSQFLTVNNQIIRDPATGTTLATRTPFPNNQIPVARFSPTARYLFSNPNLYPLPNNTGTGTLGVGSNYIGATRNYLSNKQGDAKLDYRLSDKDTLMFRYSKGMYETFGSRRCHPCVHDQRQQRPHLVGRHQLDPHLERQAGQRQPLLLQPDRHRRQSDRLVRAARR